MLHNKKLIAIIASLTIIASFTACSNNSKASQASKATKAAVAEAKKDVPATDQSGKTLTEQQKNDAAKSEVKADAVVDLVKHYMTDYYSYNTDNAEKLVEDIKTIAGTDIVAFNKKSIDYVKSTNYKSEFYRIDVSNMDFHKIPYENQNLDGVSVSCKIQYKETGSKVRNPGKLKEDEKLLEAVNKDGKWIISGQKQISEKVVEQ